MTMTALSDSASPLYEKVKDFVLGNIGSGKWARNSRLPSENELVSTLGVSRMTVHRALRSSPRRGICAAFRVWELLSRLPDHNRR